MPSIGIDLGTTNSCIGTYENGKCTIIPNSGKRTTPSYVAFDDGEILIGAYAKENLEHDGGTTIFDAKRLIGRNYDDLVAKEDIKMYPFKIVACNNKPVIVVEDGDKTLHLKPESVSSMVLKTLRENAEQYFSTKVTDVVITVPANFSSSQRQATIDAGKQAGLNVLRIINEPTAAALAYGFDKQKAGEQTVLIYDLGGGTFDVTILKITDGKTFQVIVTDGNTRLGGEMFDEKIMEYVATKFKTDHNHDVLASATPKARLKAACERTKCALSSRQKAKITLAQLIEGINLKTEFTRDQFEELCGDLFKSTILTVEKVLSDANLEKSFIDEIVLTGGCTRIPKIQQLLQEFFGKTLKMDIDQDEAVANGAALLAAKLSASPTGLQENLQALQEIQLLEVTPLSLGVRTTGGTMFTIIKRNTSIPVKKQQDFMLQENVTSAEISVYEGERVLVTDNIFLGKIQLEGLKPAGHLENGYTVTFSVNLNGILAVTVKEKLGSQEERLEITGATSLLSDEETKQRVKEGENEKEEHSIIAKKVEAFHKVEDYAYRMKQRVRDAGSEMSDDNKEKAIGHCNRTLEDLRSFRENLPELERLEAMLQDLHFICDPIVDMK